MTDQLMSPSTWRWFLTFLVGSLATVWFIYDSINLARLLGNKTLDRSDGVYRDRRFGYAMGIVIGAVGIIGCLKFHGAF